MKVCVVTNFYPPFARGGSEFVAAESALALKNLGHEVTVLTSRPLVGVRTLWPKRDIEDGIVIYRWFPLNLYYLASARHYPLVVRLVWMLIDIFNVPAVIAAAWVLRQERPDLIMSHNMKGMGGLLPRVLARYPYVHVLHDVQLVEPSGLLYPATVQKRLKNVFVSAYASHMRWCFAHVPFVVAPSQFLLDFYRHQRFFSKATSRVILNPVRSPIVAKQVHDTLRIAYIGQLEAHKGVEILLAAWKKVSDSSWRLCLVGDGALLHRAKAAAEQDERVEVKGRLMNKELEDMWATVDIVVAPSLCLENSPVVISEAIARGVPVVATTVGGIPELARLWDGIHLVPPGDSAALLAGLETVLALARAKKISTPPAMRDTTAYVQELIAMTR